ncbi:hypothetical protein ATANTOWER_014179 [Ataeniobius toweri]|uniref:Uncharacterized protein n=1 Tax=Ataeniobius toweri TaxID=208326 RepID=A0ABU7CJL7_9TELE|nr:hypothetical protein [Ataeniobius toweri]
MYPVKIGMEGLEIFQHSHKLQSFFKVCAATFLFLMFVCSRKIPCEDCIHPSEMQSCLRASGPQRTRAGSQLFAFPAVSSTHPASGRENDGLESGGVRARRRDS